MAAFQDTVESMVNDIFGSRMVEHADKYLNVTNGNIYSGAFAKVQLFYNAALPVGLALVVTFFFLELIDSATKDNFTVEHFARSLIKLVITTIVIENCVDIFNTMMSIGYSLTQEFIGAGSPKDSGLLVNAKDLVNNKLGGGGLFSNMGLMIKLFIPWVFSLLVQVGVIFACVGRALDLLIKCAFAPIGMADMFTEGLRSSGVRYLRNFLASCLSAVVMIAAIILGCSISEVALDNNFAMSDIMSVFTVVVFQAATLSLVMKAQSIAKELIAG
jgi:hypothetical protein